jgi:hypothetical protein
MNIPVHELVESPVSWVHWFAKRLTEVGSGVWEGDLVERWGTKTLVPHQKVRIAVPRPARACVRTSCIRSSPSPSQTALPI